jgi:hypothetical protein
MITIAPVPAVPATLPDGAVPALFGSGAAAGADFAAELALAMGGWEPAKPAPAPAPGDATRPGIAFPAPDRGGVLFEPATADLHRVGPAGVPVQDVTAATADQAAAAPVAPLPETSRAPQPPTTPAAPAPATPAPTTPAPAAPAPVIAAELPPVADAAAPDAEAMAGPPLPSAAPAPARPEDHRAHAGQAPDPEPLAPWAAEAEGAAAPIQARPIRADAPLTSDPPPLHDAAADDPAAAPAVEATPEPREPMRSHRAEAPPPPAADQTAVAADADTAEDGGLAETAPVVGQADPDESVATDGPTPEAPAREASPEAIVLAAAATPAARPAGEQPRTRGGVAPAGTAAQAPSGDAAAAARRSAPAEAKPGEAAEVRPGPAEPAPAADAAPEAAATVDAAEPTSGNAERPDQPAARPEATPRALAQPGGAAEALPQLQPVERTTPVAAAPLPPRVAPAPPAQQIAPVLITLAAGAEGLPDRLMLTLDPQELGRIEVEVTREGEKRIAIAVLAERPETLHLLMRDAAMLDRALAQAGVGAEGRSLAFDLGGGSDGRQQRGSGPGTPAASPSPQPDPARPRDPLSLLDIAI